MPIDDFLRELKDEYDELIEDKQSLNQKSTLLITTAGLFIPLLFGFNTFLIEKIDKSYELIILIELLLASIFFINIISIYLSSKAFLEGRYRIPFHHSTFYTEDGEFNKESIELFKNAKEDEFNDTMIHSYLRCNKENFKVNERRGKKILVSQYLFLLSLVFVFLIVLVLVIKPPSFIQQ
jgi:hypothetical protein